MRLLQKSKKLVSVIYRILLLRFFNKPCIIFSTITLTYDCNLKCKYCFLADKHKKQYILLADIKLMIDKLQKQGVYNIHLTGGEPLLHPDIVEIINYISEKDINISLSTNGYLIKDNINILKKVGLVYLSLDGNKKNNDFLRGRGSYDVVKDSLSLLRRNDIKVKISAVLTKCNAERSSICELLDLAKSFSVSVMFNLIYADVCSSKELFMDNSDINKIIGVLLNFKRKKYRRVISNSVQGLQYYLDPRRNGFVCFFQKLGVRISPDGENYFCFICQLTMKDYFLKEDFIENYYKYDKWKKGKCSKCFCGNRCESNLILNMNVFAFINALIVY